jgi:hypothetical protein
MTPLAEAVQEPKAVPLHVQAAAREVITGELM